MLGPAMLNAFVGRLFSVTTGAPAFIIPGPRLSEAATRAEVAARLTAGERVFVYFNRTLGGELSIPGTDASPEFSFDATGREASPKAAVIDSQSVKTTESGGPRGYDAGEKIKGRKRHAMVDTDGRGLTLDNHPASIQDRDGAPPLMRMSRGRWPFVQFAFMDSGYAGDRVASATAIRVEIVRKPKDQVGLPPGGVG